MVKSWVTFVRNQLKFKGVSEHTGRGAFWCDISNDLTWEQFKNRVEEILPRWQQKGIVQKIAITDEVINVLFTVQGTKEQMLYVDSYRLFHARKEDMDGRYNRYWICFTVAG